MYMCIYIYTSKYINRNCSASIMLLTGTFSVLIVWLPAAVLLLEEDICTFLSIR